MSSQGLPDFPVFNGFTEPQIEWIAGLFEQVIYVCNAMIFDQDGPADYLYLLASGKVIIRYKPYDGPALTVATIEPGSIFGWSVVLRRSAYTSSSLAVEDSIVFRLSASRLQELCDHYPETASILIRQMAGRLNERQAGAQDKILNILQSRIGHPSD